AGGPASHPRRRGPARPRARDRAAAARPAGTPPASITSTAMRLAVFVDVFSELSETFILNEVKALVTEGVYVQIEAASRSERPNPEAVDVPPVVYWDETGSRDENMRALAWLWGRHPLRTARDLLGRARWRSDEAVRPLRRLAPVARRVAESSDHINAHFAAAAALDAMRVS